MEVNLCICYDLKCNWPLTIFSVSNKVGISSSLLKTYAGSCRRSLSRSGFICVWSVNVSWCGASTNLLICPATLTEMPVMAYALPSTILSFHFYVLTAGTTTSLCTAYIMKEQILWEKRDYEKILKLMIIYAIILFNNSSFQVSFIKYGRMFRV